MKTKLHLYKNHPNTLSWMCIFIHTDIFAKSLAFCLTVTISTELVYTTQSIAVVRNSSESEMKVKTKNESNIFIKYTNTRHIYLIGLFAFEVTRIASFHSCIILFFFLFFGNLFFSICGSHVLRGCLASLMRAHKISSKFFFLT